jgi:CIC family chloride channel protein
MLVLGFLVGIGCGFLSVGFRELLSIIQVTLYGAGEGDTFITQINRLPWYYRVLIPAAGGLLVGPIIHFCAKETRGTGVPEVLKSIVTGGGAIRPRIIPLKTLLSAITIGTGGSAGREGPVVHVGSAIGSLVGSFLDLSENKLKTLIGCGAAGAIAGTFNAPLGGVIFSLEILLEDFHISEFTSIVVSSVISTAICQRYLGTNTAFDIPPFTAELWHLIPYALLGVLCGLLGVLFSKILYEINKGFESIPFLPAYGQPMIGGFLVGIIAIWFPHVYGVGYFMVESILSNEIGLALLIVLVAVKLLATTFTIGSGGSGGIFAPSLFVGAGVGGIFGKTLSLTIPGLTIAPGSSALVGMGAFVAGTIHAPLTAIILLFEMTRNYQIILPLMFACIISTVLSQSFHQYSIYTLKLFKQGLDVQSGKEANVLKRIAISSAMKSDVDFVRESDNLSRLKTIFSESHHTHYPVLADGSDEVVGVINYTQHWEFLQDDEDYPFIVCRDLARTPAVTVRKQDNLLSALEKITDFHVEVLPVVESEDQALVGILSRNDIINAYNRKLREHRHHVSNQ